MPRNQSRCPCGTFREAGDRWVVLKRSDKPTGRSLLKCLRCGWKWSSKCKYVGGLPDHKERSRSGLTDQDILDKILAWKLVVSNRGAWVDSYSNRPGCPPTWKRLKIISRTSPNGGTYRFVQIGAKGKQKKISVHRLVWMSVHKELIPEGFDVDHINGTGIPFPDAIENLRLLESSANRSRGYVSPTPELPF